MRQSWGGARLFPSCKDTGETFCGVSAAMSQRCRGGTGPRKRPSTRALSSHGLGARIHLLKQSLLLNWSKSHSCVSAEVALTTFISNNPESRGPTFLAWREEIPNNWYRAPRGGGGCHDLDLGSLEKDTQIAHWDQPGPRREVSSRRLEGTLSRRIRFNTRNISIFWHEETNAILPRAMSADIFWRREPAGAATSRHFLKRTRRSRAAPARRAHGSGLEPRNTTAA